MLDCKRTEESFRYEQYRSAKMVAYIPNMDYVVLLRTGYEASKA